VLLLLVAAAWSAAWFAIRERATEAIDRGLALEARAGRHWTCADRRIGGYPFRIELSCADLTLRRGPVTASLGPLLAVAQVYRPGHVIAELRGPLRVTDGTLIVDGSWRLLETSVRASPGGLQRISLVAEAPQVRITGAGSQEIALSSESLEAHLRPNPSRGETEAAYDAAIVARQARLPVMDLLVGGAEPTDIQIDLTATQAEGFRGKPVVEELERWRAADGRLDILQLALAKGARRVQAKGDLRLDALHRPAGQLQVAAAGLDGLLANLTGGGAAGGILGALLGQAPAPQAAEGGGRGLSPLPPLRIENGRLMLGPFVVPSVRVPALY
jgi:hypothetical protein